MLKLRHLLAVAILCSMLASVCALAQSSLTQIRDVITNPDGTPFNGMVVITWNGFSVPNGTPISQLSASARIYNGALSVLLVPTTTAAAGTYYQVVYSSSDGTVTWTETWQVPPSTSPLTISQVRQTTTEGSGGTTTTTTGSGNYATLPIAISQVTNLSSTLSTLTSQISTLNSQVSALASGTSVSSLQTTVNALGTTVSGLTNTVNGLSTTVTGLSSTVSSNSSTLTSLNTTVGSMSSTVTGLSGSVTALSNTVAGLSATVNTLSTAGSSAVFVDDQSLSGTLNGTNTAFNLASAPSPSASLALYRNGLLQAPSVDYTLAGAVVTFLAASTPQSTDTLVAYYRVPGAGTSSTIVDSEVPSGAINGTNMAFTLANAPNPSASLKLYKNGLLLAQGGDYSLSGAAITFTSTVAPQTGDSLVAAYRH